MLDWEWVSPSHLWSTSERRRAQAQRWEKWKGGEKRWWRWGEHVLPATCQRKGFPLQRSLSICRVSPFLCVLVSSKEKMGRNCMCCLTGYLEMWFFPWILLSWPTSNICQVIFHACIGQLNLAQEAWWDRGCPLQGWCHVLDIHQFLSKEGGICLGHLPRKGQAFLTTQAMLRPR